jgi:thymidylate synthase ThyX
MISAVVVADSISPAGKRLTTMQLRYPRFIHAEFMTHRVFSRNASSSRAIPVKKLIADLRREPAMPVFWGSNKPGMQAGDELGALDRTTCERQWLLGMEYAIGRAESMVQHGLHKQIANRILEPWAHINVVVTATEWDNFYELRVHPDAQPEMRSLAQAMLRAYIESTPVPLTPGDWHLPYVTGRESFKIEELIKLSVARCARVSYLTHEGKPPNAEDDIKLYERLVGSRPLHASPAEHQATPDRRDSIVRDDAEELIWENADEHGNFVGWRQFRRQLEKSVWAAAEYLEQYRKQLEQQHVI